ncbi:MAG: hypothetical protein KAF42_07490 [Sphingopyxis terrae]|nr:hypothetical protein [Sphingopyxis terrae]
MKVIISATVADKSFAPCCVIDAEIDVPGSARVRCFERHDLAAARFDMQFHARRRRADPDIPSTVDRQAGCPGGKISDVENIARRATGPNGPISHACFQQADNAAAAHPCNLQSRAGRRRSDPDVSAAVDPQHFGTVRRAIAANIDSERINPWRLPDAPIVDGVLREREHRAVEASRRVIRDISNDPAAWVRCRDIEDIIRVGAIHDDLPVGVAGQEVRRIELAIDLHAARAEIIA